MSRRTACVALCAAVVLLWWSAFDHPLYPSDEGRYATIAARMAESGDWLVPYFRGQSHLTKPPLTYWLEGVGILAFGRNEFAVRLPSLIASTAVLVMVFVSLSRWRGRPAATCAAMLYAILPVAVIFGRIASTDAILNCWWTLALVAGFRAVTRRSRGAALLFWTAIALAALTKGPVALGPVGIIVVWRLLAGDHASLRFLRPMWGVPLAVAPVVGWALAIAGREPALWSTWWTELVSRATGELGKHGVWWYYVPIFLVGMFPASAMLTLPIFNISFAEAWRRLRDGSFESLFVVAIVAPLVAFSLVEGKLPSYLLPIAPPLAMVVGTMLASRWIETATDIKRAPDVRITVFVCCAIVSIAMPIAYRRIQLPEDLRATSFLFLLPLVGVGWLALCWRDLAARRRGLVIAWGGFAAAWIVAFHVENVMLERESPRELGAALERLVGDDAEVFVVGNSDPSRSFYRRGLVRDLGGNVAASTVREAMQTARAAVFTDDQWDRFRRDQPDYASFLDPVHRGSSFFRREYVICRVRKSPANM